MTTPVTLYGTQSNGETLPVQVDEFGRLVAEGLQGSEGPPGPPGEPGADGADGGAFPLPPDPYEGAVLGWLDGGLAWIGTPPIVVPEGVFGPITSWDPHAGVIEVEGPIPTSVITGVYLWQVDSDGNNYTNDFLVSADYLSQVTASATISNPEAMFDGTDAQASCIPGTSANMRWTPPSPIQFNSKIEVRGSNGQSGGGEWKMNRSYSGTITVAGQDGTDWLTLTSSPGTLYNIDLSTQSGGCRWAGIRIDGKELLLPQYSNNFRVNSLMGENALVGTAIPDGANFVPGFYLKVPEQRVAPWVAAARRSR